jgi:hypothetical protein
LNYEADDESVDMKVEQRPTPSFSKAGIISEKKLLPFAINDHSEVSSEDPPIPNPREEEKSEEPEGTHDGSFLTRTFKPYLEDAKHATPAIFKLSCTPALLKEMEKEFAEIEIAEDHTTSEEMIKLQTQFCIDEVAYEVERYNQGLNHHKI